VIASLHALSRFYWKDAISRDILKAFDKAGIGIATTAYNIVGFPSIRIENGASVPQEDVER
jgi:hypothetical protein